MTKETGITFRHTDGSSGHRYIVETVSAGLATFDYDLDGDIDIYFLNGAPLRGASMQTPPRNKLYRNDGNWRFTDVSDVAGVGDTGFGLGVAVGDYDNDGDPDIYVTNFGPNRFYANNGDGTFRDATDEAGVAGGDRFGAGACFLDIEGDGDLDLYCANYVQFTYQNHVDAMVDGLPRYAGPKDYEPELDVLFRNDGNGRFSDISDAAGIASHAGSGMGVVGLDYDADRDTDILVLNDVRGNFLFQNDGTGHFEDVGLLVGVAYNIDGKELGSMGVDCGDIDNDGALDVFQTSYAGELPALYHNAGLGFFEDVTRPAQAGASCYPFVNWGVGIVDFNNDGYRDLFIANGHLQDNVELYDDTTTYRVANTILQNQQGKRFVDVSKQCGDGLAPVKSSRGAAFDDLDNDGRVDAVILNSRNTPTVIRNESSANNHWIELRLHGLRSNRDGAGTRVTVVAGEKEFVAEVHDGRGYQSHFGTRLHFGLGPETTPVRVEVQWLGGSIQVLDEVPVDRLIDIRETDEVPLPRS